MRPYQRNDDLLKGNGNNNVKTSDSIVLPFKGDDDYISRELLRIVAVHKSCDLSQQPEVLAGMLDDLKAKVKGGNVLEILRDPLVYGSISVALLLIIIFKMKKRGKK